MFDHSKILYSSSPVELNSIMQVELPKNDEWKEAIKAGDIIDALYPEKEEGSNTSVLGWRRAEVILKASESIIVRLLNSITSM